MRGRVDHLGREADLRRAVVYERHRLLELLREDGDEVHAAVPVQVDGNGADCSWLRIHEPRLEGRMRVVDRVVLEDGEVADLAPAERGHRQVQRAVAVEVGRFDVGHARPAVERELLVASRGRAAQQHDRTARVVRGQELAKVRHQEVLNPVAVESTLIEMCDGFSSCAMTLSSVLAV